MTKELFDREFNRLKYRFGYMSDEFLRGLGEEYYRHKDIKKISPDKFAKLIDAIIVGDSQYMLTVFQMLALYHNLFKMKGGYNQNCGCDNGFRILIKIADNVEYAVPCSCNRSFKKNYQDFLNTGRYKLIQR